MKELARGLTGNSALTPDNFDFCIPPQAGRRGKKLVLSKVRVVTEQQVTLKKENSR
jgi:hypothetical protein